MDNYYLVRDYKCSTVRNIEDLKSKIQPGDYALIGWLEQKGLESMVYRYKILDSSLNEFTLEINNWKLTKIRNKEIIGPTCLIVSLRDPQNKLVEITIKGVGESAINEMLLKFKSMAGYTNWWHYHFEEEEARFEQIIGDLKETNRKLLTENNSLNKQLKAIKHLLNEEDKISS